MDVYEKALARCIFQNKIYRSDGQSFQDLFVSIMNYAEESFQLIKPWGNIGDRKNDGYMQVSSLEEYLASNGDFLADTLRDKVNKVYFEERVLHEGDELFWAIVDNLSPRVEQHYQTTVIVIMAKYFETCDIFDTPSSEEKNDNSN